MSQITLIAAIGRQGQLGLWGDMPWGRSYPDDLKRFREITTSGIVIVGYNTWPTIEHLAGTAARTFIKDGSNLPVKDTIARLRAARPTRPIFVAGGAKTYERWLPFVTAFDVTSLPYDGPADVWAPFLIPHITRTIP